MSFCVNKRVYRIARECVGKGCDVLAKNDRGHTPFALCTDPEATVVKFVSESQRKISLQVQQLLQNAMNATACKATLRVGNTNFRAGVWSAKDTFKFEEANRHLESSSPRQCWDIFALGFLSLAKDISETDFKKQISWSFPDLDKTTRPGTLWPTYLVWSCLWCHRGRWMCSARRKSPRPLW